jgi:hypothetical protein
MAKRSLNLTIRIDQETLDILDNSRARERIRSSRAEYIRMLIRYAYITQGPQAGRFVVQNIGLENGESF